MLAPLIVVEGSDAAYEAAVAETRASGWTVADGFSTGTLGARRLVRSGHVANAEDAAEALMVALAGCGLVIAARAPDDVMARLLGDLRHVGPIDHRRPSGRAVPTLAASQRALLALVAQGRTLGEAASELGLSRRTADRRLAEARERLGVERTPEAIAKARRLRLLG